MRSIAGFVVVIALIIAWCEPVTAGGVDDSESGVATASSEGRRIEVGISVGGGTTTRVGRNPLAGCVILTDLLPAAVIDYAGGRGINVGITNPDMENAVDEDGNPQPFVFVSCPEAVIGGFRWAVWAQSDPVPADVLEALGNAAVASIELLVPTPETAPDGLVVPFLTQLPVWLWVPEATWVPATARAELVELGVWVQATASPRSTEWEAEGVGSVTCGQGLEWNESLRDDETDCLLTFESTTPRGTTIDLSVATTYTITVQCSVGVCPNGIDLNPVVLVATRPVTVTEMRGVIVR